MNITSFFIWIRLPSSSAERRNVSVLLVDELVVMVFKQVP